MVPRAISRESGKSGVEKVPGETRNLGYKTGRQLAPGTLPESASLLPDSARNLLMRLLERDPKIRMRNLRQLQQSAFYMTFNFEQIKAKKVHPRSLLDSHFPDGPPKSVRASHISDDVLTTFDQVVSI